MMVSGVILTAGVSVNIGFSTGKLDYVRRQDRRQSRKDLGCVAVPARSGSKQIGSQMPGPCCIVFRWGREVIKNYLEILLALTVR